MEVQNNFGENLKKYRKESKMTQAELANLLGKSASTIYGYETNQIMPSYDTVCMISSVFNVDISNLLDLNQKKKEYTSDREIYDNYLERWLESRR